MNRRTFVSTSAGVLLAAGATTSLAQPPRDAVPADFRIRHGRIRQSIMGWTYNDRMKMLDLAKLCQEIGLVAMEGISPDLYPQVREMGLQISLGHGGHGFAKGPCDPRYRQFTVDQLSESIEVAVKHEIEKVITFTGMKYEGIDRDEAAQGCVDVWKQVIPLAQSKNITLVLEHLNSKDDSHPMKGHPGYFGDDVDFCVDLIKQVDSPHMKLLFDVYHVSIMNGDVIRRIRKYKDVIGHYHTAGNPGRCELDDSQEINYPAVMKEILATGYTGYVAHEFLPNWDDHKLSLRHAAMVCDV